MLIQKKITINKEDAEWFEGQFPGSSLSAILCLLLEKFRNHTKQTFLEAAEEAAKELTEET